jgi:digeranylgeranylglycerophospholipid reductase
MEGGVMADMNYDVVIVGCGPAGSMAGRSAALNGANVLIIEKKSAIGIPNHCNECIAAPHLWEERLGFKLNPNVYSQRITKFAIVAPSGKMTPPLENDCIMVERNLFDRTLAEEAVRAGARIMLNVRVVDLLRKGDAVAGVVVQRGDHREKIDARVVIGCDANNVVASAAGIPGPDALSHWLVKEFAGVKGHDPETCYTYMSPRFAPELHAPHMPKGPDTANLSVGIPRGYSLTLTEAYDELMRHPMVKEFFGDASPVRISGGTAPLGGLWPKPYGDGVMLAGDAAGHMWEANGGGINPAMMAGHFAGETAARAIQQGDTSEQALASYHQKYLSTIGKTNAVQHEAKELLDRVIASDELIERAVAEIGKELVGLYTYARGYTDVVKDWLTEQNA